MTTSDKHTPTSANIAYEVDGQTFTSKEYAAKYMREVLGETDEEIQRVLGQ